MGPYQAPHIIIISSANIQINHRMANYYQKKAYFCRIKIKKHEKKSPKQQ